MDIPRTTNRKKRRYLYAGAGALAVILITVVVGNLKPAAPTVERATVWIDAVKRGQMLRQVRGPGTLVPEHIQWVSAVTAGRVQAIHVRPGTTVKAETALLELSNPDVQLELLEAQRQLAAAEAELVSLRTNLQSQLLNQKSLAASARADYLEAKRVAESDRELVERELIASNEAQRSQERVTAAATRAEIEQERYDVMARALDENLALLKTQVDRLRAIYAFQQGQVESMQVLAGAEGVLQEFSLEPGQWVIPGQTLAKVAQPGKLKAVLRIPETQARDVAIGQPVQVDTRNGIASGRVARIDPSVLNGTVTVDVTLEGTLPRGARPDLSVDGTIEVERLDDVLYVGRPAYGQAESVVGLFKLVEGGDEAVRVQVRLGRSSVNTIEIQDGLQEGDRVILSDMSAWDAVDRVRLD